MHQWWAFRVSYCSTCDESCSPWWARQDLDARSINHSFSKRSNRCKSRKRCSSRNSKNINRREINSCHHAHRRQIRDRCSGSHRIRFDSAIRTIARTSVIAAKRIRVAKRAIVAKREIVAKRARAGKRIRALTGDVARGAADTGAAGTVDLRAANLCWRLDLKNGANAIRQVSSILWNEEWLQNYGPWNRTSACRTTDAILQQTIGLRSRVIVTPCGLIIAIALLLKSRQKSKHSKPCFQLYPQWFKQYQLGFKHNQLSWENDMSWIRLVLFLVGRSSHKTCKS